MSLCRDTAAAAQQLHALQLARSSSGRSAARAQLQADAEATGSASAQPHHHGHRRAPLSRAASGTLAEAVVTTSFAADMLLQMGLDGHGPLRAPVATRWAALTRGPLSGVREEPGGPDLGEGAVYTPYVRKALGRRSIDVLLPPQRGSSSPTSPRHFPSSSGGTSGTASGSSRRSSPMEGGGSQCGAGATESEEENGGSAGGGR